MERAVVLGAPTRGQHEAEHAALALAEAAPRGWLVGTRLGVGGVSGFIAPSADVLAGGDRIIRFPGQDVLRGVLSARTIRERSAIQRLRALGAVLTEDALVDTKEFVRPIAENGELVLLVTPLADGSFQPFEREHPHRCCELDMEATVST